jgi:NADPH:quinone reductase
MHLVPQRELVASMVADLMQAIEAGELEVVIGGVYPMSEVRQAHEDIAARRTQGKLLLDPAG